MSIPSARIDQKAFSAEVRDGRSVSKPSAANRAKKKSLIELATIFGTDKWNGHWYAQHYERYFQPLRHKKLRVLEIGVGGYDHPRKGGASLRMWKAYFPKSKIYGIDLFDKKALEEDRIRIFQGSQSDSEFLQTVVDETGPLDIVIDDGSHINSHVIETFETLFPLMKENAIYAIEDTQTSYWPGFGGSSDELNSQKTIMGYFKALADGLNHAEFIRPDYTPSYFDKHIMGICFYHNLIFIFKGRNDEGSNIIKDNRTDEDWVLKESGLSAHYEWMRQQSAAAEEISELVPPSETFILVDEKRFDSQAGEGRNSLPFPERDDKYFGPPADDKEAIRELERMRGQFKPKFIVFGWPAFWWLDYYTEFNSYLRSRFNCVLENERLVVFDLRA